MSFFGKKKDADYKVRLERKLFLARSDPEPVFDISECDLKAVPSGIFSLCKVLRKEHLFLQCNQLARLQDGGNISDLVLLITLDLHSNKFTILPQDISFLRNLKDLNVGNNLLKELPDVLCELTALESLDVSFNKLKYLPSLIGNLKQLQALKAQGNKQLSRLPNSLGKLKRNLQSFDVDVNNLEYPPPDVSVDGPTAVMKYLAKAYELLHGIGDYSFDNTMDVTAEFDSKLQHGTGSERSDDCVQDTLKHFQKQKEDRIKELIEIEKGLKVQKEKEFELQKRNKEEKDKLLENILVHENCLQNKLLEFQIQKDEARLKLIDSLQKVEDESDRLLENILQVSQTLRNPSLLEELDRAQREEMLSFQTQQLRRKEVLEAMDRILAEELEHNDKLMNYKHSRESSFRDHLLREEEMERRLVKTANEDRCIRADGNKWLAELKQSCGKQGMVLGILLEKTDIQSQALLSEVTLVEQQLATLTSVELQRKQLNTDQRLNELSTRRIALSELLLDLISQQEKRRNQLLQTLVDVQEKNQVTNEDDDFWLEQYQRLMDQCPDSLLYAQRLLDPLLIHFLVQENVTHCIPNIATCAINDIDDRKLEEIKVPEKDIPAIIYAIKRYKEEKSRQIAPSAPAMQQDPGPSAPPESPVLPSGNLVESEVADSQACVICMEREYRVVLIPCGHLCVCVECVTSLKDCPMCRATIQQKICVIVP